MCLLKVLAGVMRHLLSDIWEATSLLADSESFPTLKILRVGALIPTETALNAFVSNVRIFEDKLVGLIHAIQKSEATAVDW